MPLSLTSRQQQLFTAALRAMVTIDAAESSKSWEFRVLRALKPLVRAERGAFFYDAADGLEAGASEDYDDGLLSDYRRYYSQRDPGRRRWAAKGGPVFSRAMLFQSDLDPLIRSECYNDFLAPAGMGDSAGLALPDDGTGSPGIIALHRADYGSEDFSIWAPVLLNMLYPAFVSGWRARRRLDRQAENFSEMIESLAEAAAIYGVDGRLLHANRRLLDLVGTGTGGVELRDAMDRAAGSLCSLRDDDGTCWPRQAPAAPQPGYRVQATLLDSLVPGTLVLVTAQPVRSVLPPSAVLIRRFGLTRRQAEVALLLARRLTNREIAEQLTISPHTALRHTEVVKSKLGVRDRRKVAERITESKTPVG